MAGGERAERRDGTGARETELVGNEGSRKTDYMAKKQSSHCGCCCERPQVARTVHGSCPSLALSVEAVRTTAAYFQTQLSPMVWCTFLTREKLALWYAAFDLPSQQSRQERGGRGRSPCSACDVLFTTPGGGEGERGESRPGSTMDVSPGNARRSAPERSANNAS